MKKPAVYIITNKYNSTLYVGVTSDLLQRIFEHKSNTHPGFSKKYRCHKLVFYEIYDDMYTAITREKQIKKGSRTKKLNLINAMNPNWRDFYEDIIK